jgi:hypothetical protein
MIFDWRCATGKAGERRVESFVEEELNLIYRKVGLPDIGVDGEIEFLDEKRKATGGALKVQVKATDTSVQERHTLRVPFDEDHLDYFASLMVQPILAVVSLPDKKIWWKPILHKSKHRGPRGGFAIKLDTTVDLLTLRSSDRLRMWGERSNAIIAWSILEEAKDHLNEMDEQQAANNFDSVTAGCWAQTIGSVQNALRDSECLLRFERRYSEEVTKSEKRYLEIAERVEAWRTWFKENELLGLLEDFAPVVE